MSAIAVRRLGPPGFHDFAAFLATPPGDGGMGESVSEALAAGPAQRLLRGHPHRVAVADRAGALLPPGALAEAPAPEGWRATLERMARADVIVLSRVIDDCDAVEGQALLAAAAARARRLLVVRLGPEGAARWKPERLGDGFVSLVAQEPAAAAEAAIAFAWIAADGTLRRDTPHFSIMTPVYNHLSYVGAALDSLRAQDYPHWQGIVVDDGSTDGSGEYLADALRHDDRFRLIHQPNRGISGALNTALGAATAPWIGWLSSDDLFLHNKLAAHAAAIRRDEGAAPFHVTSALYLREGRLAPVDGLPLVLGGSRAARLVGMANANLVNGITPVVHRTLYDAVGGFSELHPYTQDYVAWTRMMRRADPTYLPLVTAVTRIGPQQTGKRAYALCLAAHLRATLDFLKSLDHAMVAGDAAGPAATEAVLEAAAALFGSALRRGTVLGMAGLQDAYLDQAIALARGAIDYGDDLRHFERRLSPWTASLAWDLRAQAAWSRFVAGLHATQPPGPLDTGAALRRVAADPTVPAELRKGIAADLERLDGAG